MVQINMEMPSSCDRCPLCDEDMCICKANEYDVEDEWYNGLKPITCPLKEVDGVESSDKPSGKWIANAPQYDMLNPQYICSECGNVHTKITPYCEMCGSKMGSEDNKMGGGKNE